jgi:hypothetical protein
LEPWVGVDFDGTLAYSVPFQKWDGSCGEPLMPMVERVKALRKKGVVVKIVTARVSSTNAPEDHLDPKIGSIEAQRKLIEDWCLTHIGEVLPVTAEKDFYMEVLYDDRVIRVQHNSGFTLDEANR